MKNFETVKGFQFQLTQTRTTTSLWLLWWKILKDKQPTRSDSKDPVNAVIENNQVLKTISKLILFRFKNLHGY